MCTSIGYNELCIKQKNKKKENIVVNVNLFYHCNPG